MINRRNIIKNFMMLLVSLVICFSSIPYYAAADGSSIVLDNGKLRFGNGTLSSVNSKGSLLQPFYYGTVNSNTGWYKLTYSAYPLNSAIGVGGDGTNEWNANGTIVADSALSNQIIDASGYTSTGTNMGYGIIVSTGEITIGGQKLEIKNTYTLGQESSFIKIISKITNKDEDTLTNLRFWTGTQDDYIAGQDDNRKQKGNLIDGTFTKITNQTDLASALLISSGDTGVLFYSTSTKANTLVYDYDDFENVVQIDPASSPIDIENDGSYALYVRMNDLAPGESEEFTWYYAAGDLDKLGDVASEVGEDAGQTNNTSGLSAKLTAANGKLTTNTEGTSVGQASEAARTALQTAIDAAQAVFDDAANKTQVEIDAAVATLQAAIDAFIQEVIQAGDATNLYTAITSATQALTDHPQGSGVGQASQSARTALQTAIDAAQDVFDNAGSKTQAEIDAAIATLQAAMTVFDNAVIVLTPTPTLTQDPQPTPTTDIGVIVNGKIENTGTSTTTKVNNRTVTTVTMNQKKLMDRLQQESMGATITIPVNMNSDVVIGELNGQMVKSMEEKKAILEVKTNYASYTLPAGQINISSKSDQLGSNIDLKDIKIQIEIASPTAESAQVVESAAANGEFTIIAPPIEFTVRATYGDQTIEVKHFNAFVERTIAIPDGIDPNKITTGVVVDLDGTVRHVPTKVVKIGERYYAVINSLTNSLYSVVWHPLTFADVEKHWAKDAINDMGSRMVVTGVGNGLFDPNADVTRAEFAAIIVRGLGLKLDKSATNFTDVKVTDWYNSAIKTATEYKLITGYTDGTFRPQDKITREQALAIIARAMQITGLKERLTSSNIDQQLGGFVDVNQISAWAKVNVADCVQAAIITGKNDNKMAPKDNMTRAEVATIVQNLLQKSELINY